MTEILIALYEGVSAFEAMGALAACRAADVPALLVAPEALVRTEEGARLVPDKLGYDGLASAPAVVLPHGAIAKARTDAALSRALRDRRGRFTLASGDALQLLAGAGLAEGRRVARMPGETLAGATVVHARLVADARLLTCFAGDPLVDLVLHYVGHEHGHPRAEKAAARLGREYRAFAFGQQSLPS